MKKRIISTIALICGVACFLSMLAGCPNTGNNSSDNPSNNPQENDTKKTALTLDNYENYLSLSCTFGGDPSTKHWNSLNGEYRYNAVMSTVTINPVASYLKFDSCVITVKIKGEYYYTASAKSTYSHDHTVRLSIGGTGTSSDSYKQSNCHRIKGIGYEVVSVSGYVIVE